MVNIENTSTAKLKICPSQKREMVPIAVTARVKYDNWGEI